MMIYGKQQIILKILHYIKYTLALSEDWRPACHVVFFYNSSLSDDLSVFSLECIHFCDQALW